MARPLEPLADHDDTLEPAGGRRGGGIDLSSARAFAAALAALVIASLVVTQSVRTLQFVGTAAGNNFEAGTVTLTDDDEGRSLVDLRAMAPGRPVEQCLQVSYQGTILPADLAVKAVTNGSLAPYVLVTLEAGSGGRFGSCDGFEPSSTVFDGTVAGLVQRGQMPVGRIRNKDDGLSFRFRYELADDERAIGKTAVVDVLWEAEPS
jgi:hypothetical protein